MSVSVEEGVVARVMTGFLNNNHHPFSRPTCSQIFKRVANDYGLQVTDNFALARMDDKGYEKEI